jgi:hypothetical protein
MRLRLQLRLRLGLRDHGPKAGEFMTRGPILGESFFYPVLFFSPSQFLLSVMLRLREARWNHLPKEQREMHDAPVKELL